MANEFTRDELALLMRRMRQDESYNRTCWEQNQKRPQRAANVKARRATLEQRIAITDSLIAKLQERLDALGPLPGLEG